MAAAAAEADALALMQREAKGEGAIGDAGGANPDQDVDMADAGAQVKGELGADPPQPDSSQDCDACRGKHRAHTCSKGLVVSNGTGRGGGRGGGRGRGGRSSLDGPSWQPKSSGGGGEDGPEDKPQGEVRTSSRRASKKTTNYAWLADEEDPDPSIAGQSPQKEYERMIKRQRLLEQSASHLTAGGLGGGRGSTSTHEPGLVGGAANGAYSGHGNHVTRMLEHLDAFAKGTLSALYASDITYPEELMPEPNTSLGEAAPTTTRSGVMDSLLQASLLRFSPLIPGVNYPMTYLGARNTFFCWHVEDNHLYATNYVVAGAPKVWYGVPLSHMGRMEKVWQESLPKLFETHPDLCYYKTCIFSPQVLAANNVPVYRAVHEAGTFMITTPGAYHTGFNTGFNVAESTNFAFADWLPVGARALSRYRTPPTRDTTVLHDALIVTAAQHALPRELPPLLDELRDMLRNETDALRSLAEAGVMMPPAAALEQLSPPWEDGSSDDSYMLRWRCRVCRHLSYFAVVRCNCGADGYLCLRHGLHMQDDTPTPRAYIHRDEDPEGAARQDLAAKRARLSSAAHSGAPAPAVAPPAAAAAAIGTAPAQSGVINPAPSVPPPAGHPPPSLPPSPAHSEADETMPMAPVPPQAAAGAGAAATGAAPAAMADAAATPATCLPCSAPSSAAPPLATLAPPAQQPATRCVRLTCTGCQTKLKAQIPLHVKRITTSCTACKRQLTAVVQSAAQTSGAQSVGQSGRARHLAGELERTSSHEPGAGAFGAERKCACAPCTRRVLVQHPMQQLQRLIDELQLKCLPSSA